MLRRKTLLLGLRVKQIAANRANAQKPNAMICVDADGLDWLAEAWVLAAAR